MSTQVVITTKWILDHKEEIESPNSPWSLATVTNHLLNKEGISISRDTVRRIAIDARVKFNRAVGRQGISHDTAKVSEWIVSHLNTITQESIDKEQAQAMIQEEIGVFKTVQALTTLTSKLRCDGRVPRGFMWPSKRKMASDKDEDDDIKTVVVNKISVRDQQYAVDGVRKLQSAMKMVTTILSKLRTSQLLLLEGSGYLETDVAYKDVASLLDGCDRLLRYAQKQSQFYRPPPSDRVGQ